MGGKAIQIAERVKAGKFFRYAREIVPRVEKAFDTEVHMVQSFKNKSDFGDLDLLVLADRDFGNRRKILEDYFHPQEISINSHIVSFNYNELQVDLIFTPTNNWEASKIYFDYDPSGNLIGKLAHKFGMKYGYKGLIYPYIGKNGGKHNKQILISTDQKKIFDFLDLDYDLYLKGFDKMEDIFDFIINSKYFNPVDFQFDNLNSINKQRNKKRGSYKMFLEYIKNKSSSDYVFKHKDYYLPIIDKYFKESNLLNEIKSLEQISKRSKEISLKFNGRIVKERYPELKGIKLGYIMNKFYLKYNDDYILNNGVETLLNNIRELF